jgi:hypothetical protein
MFQTPEETPENHISSVLCMWPWGGGGWGGCVCVFFSLPLDNTVACVREKRFAVSPASNPRNRLHHARSYKERWAVCWRALAGEQATGCATSPARSTCRKVQAESLKVMRAIHTPLRPARETASVHEKLYGNGTHWTEPERASERENIHFVIVSLRCHPDVTTCQAASTPNGVSPFRLKRLHGIHLRCIESSTS